MAATASHQSVMPALAKFIRLGPQRSWAKAARETGTIRFGVPSEPHDLCLKGDWKGVEAALAHSGRRSQKISELKGQLSDFYTLGSACLWITAVDRRLWWGFAEPEVIDLRGSGDEMGIVARRLRGGWNCKTIGGLELDVAALGTAMTVTRYPGALCNVRELEAVCRAINGQ